MGLLLATSSTVADRAEMSEEEQVEEQVEAEVAEQIEIQKEVEAADEVEREQEASEQAFAETGNRMGRNTDGGQY